MPPQQILRIFILGLVFACNSLTLFAEPGFFTGKLVFFGAKRDSDDKSTISTWSPVTGDVSEVVSSGDEILFRGRISPDGTMLVFSVATSQNDSSFEAPRLDVVDAKGQRRKLADEAELVAWLPDSKSILCRRGKKYNWSHFHVDVDAGSQSAVPIDTLDAVMDVAVDGTLCVMKGRPDVLWERKPGDFYPKRQLYFMSPKGDKEMPFTSADEDCIWWRYAPLGKRGVYYRRHYNTGRPIETAMVADADGKNSRQIVNFTELAVRPNGLPVWRPDGKEIAWIVDRETKEDHFDYEIMFAEVDGGLPRFVTAKELGFSSPGNIDWK